MGGNGEKLEKLFWKEEQEKIYCWYTLGAGWVGDQRS